MRKFFNILSMVVLLGGIVSGAVLVQQEQDIRKSASSEGKVSICHKTGNEGKFQKIELDESAVDLHLEHGDTLSGCDDLQDTETTLTDSPPEPRNLDDKADTFTEPLNSNVFSFSLKLQGIENKAATKNVTLTFLNQNGSQNVFNTSANSDSSGVYSGEILGVEAGNYDVLVKVDSYLSKLFSNVQVNSGTNIWDWTESTLITGDFNNDDVFNILDVGMILAIYDEQNVVVTPQNRKYDVNADNVIDQKDVDLVLDNYTSFSIEGGK